ncbi:hypothetical protein ACIRD2_27645 [Streptomyces sp. NPDC093595]|uniref:hypothetical protein n=1 Tax=Streptomyces sp. NPDC093595 TaxID=3366045 RepID=UPI0037FF1BE3
MTFSGFPPPAPRLHEDLAAGLPGHFAPHPGALRLLGPVRDTRMVHDKPPYKTYRGAWLDAGRRPGPGPAPGPARAAAFVRETWEPARPLLDRPAARGITPHPRNRGADPTP